MIEPTPGDAWEWCPAHECWFAAGDPCPRCRCDAALGLGECPADYGQHCEHCHGPLDPPDRPDDPGDFVADPLPPGATDDAWDLDDVVNLGPDPAELADGWYLDLVRRAEFPGADPHGGWRD